MAPPDKQLEATAAAPKGPAEGKKPAVEITGPLADAAALAATLTPAQKPGADTAKEELHGTLTELAKNAEAARGEARSALAGEGFVKEAALPPGPKSLPETLLASADNAKELANKVPPELLNRDYQARGTNVAAKGLDAMMQLA